VNVIIVLLLLLAAIFFALTAFGIASSRVNLLALGLFCWVLVPLILAVKTL